MSVAEVAERPAHRGRALNLWLAFLLLIGAGVALAWWGAGDAIEPREWAFDFRVGGHESNRSAPGADFAFGFDATYHDLVPDERIVYTYEMLLDGKRISVSLTSIELEPDGEGTRLRLTEHGAFFDGHEPAANRTDGVGSLLDALGSELERGPA